MLRNSDLWAEMPTDNHNTGSSDPPSAWAGGRPGSSGSGCSGSRVFPVPPAAPQSLEQGRGVGVAISLGLGEIQHGLLTGLFGIQQCQVPHRTQLYVAANSGEAFVCGTFRSRTGVERLSIELKRGQCIRDILERSQDRGPVLSSCLIERGTSRAFLVEQCAACEQC